MKVSIVKYHQCFLWHKRLNWSHCIASCAQFRYDLLSMYFPRQCTVWMCSKELYIKFFRDWFIGETDDQIKLVAVFWLWIVCNGFYQNLMRVYWLLSLHVFTIFSPSFFALVLMNFVLSVMFVAQISTSFSIPVPRMWVLYHNFYCIFACYLLPN
jgi:hypothetical protein